MSSFQYSTRDPIQTAAAPQNLSEYCDFIIFLGIAQNLSIDFLPITWQQALQNIGEGATAEIREALLDSNTSFAFKRRLFKESFNSEELTGQILPSVIAEISILLTPSMRHCPHIMNVVGICWEIYSADEYTFSRHEPVDFSGAAVVPVLVFEKSKYGDLHSFMTNGAGKTLSFDERLQLCLEIAEAVSLMHSESMCLHFHPRRLTLTRQMLSMAISNLRMSSYSRHRQKFIPSKWQTSATLPFMLPKAI